MANIQTLNPSHPAYGDYADFVRLFNGLSYDRAIAKVNDLGLSYGAANPRNSTAELDINFRSICATLIEGAQGIMEVSPDFEIYL